MKRNALVLVLCALALAGCVCRPTVPESTNPQVAVIGDRLIVVSPEPLVFLSDQRDAWITWHLPKGSKFRFGQEGIVIEKGGDEFVKCGPREEGLAFACLNRHTRKGTYKYTVNVRAGEKRLAPLDPTIYNE